VCVVVDVTDAPTTATPQGTFCDQYQRFTPDTLCSSLWFCYYNTLFIGREIN